MVLQVSFIALLEWFFIAAGRITGNSWPAIGTLPYVKSSVRRRLSKRNLHSNVDLPQKAPYGILLLFNVDILYNRRQIYN